MKTYSELIKLPTFEERFEYLKLSGSVGAITFGCDRTFNQMFYTRAREWEQVRRQVINRDNACDLGVRGHELEMYITIHHINPITLDDILESTDILLDPEYLITTSSATHRKIHYGNLGRPDMTPTKRVRNDTCPWKRYH